MILRLSSALCYGWHRPAYRDSRGLVLDENRPSAVVVYGLQRTTDAVSAHGEMHMSISLLIFFIVYGSGVWYRLHLYDETGSAKVSRRRCLMGD